MTLAVGGTLNTNTFSVNLKIVDHLNLKLLIFYSNTIAPDKDWRQLGIYPPLFDLIGYLKFKIGYLKFLYWVSI